MLLTHSQPLAPPPTNHLRQAIRRNAHVTLADESGRYKLDGRCAAPFTSHHSNPVCCPRILVPVLACFFTE